VGLPVACGRWPLDPNAYPCLGAGRLGAKAQWAAIPDSDQLSLQGNFGEILRDRAKQGPRDECVCHTTSLAAYLAGELRRGIASALAQGTAAGETDMFAYMIQRLGEPKHASRMTTAVAAGYAGRVPEALTRFWVEHGRGAYLDGMYWIVTRPPLILCCS